MSRWTQTDRRWMQLALDLACKGRGFVEPNPMVGCVLVRSNRIVGRGFHRRFGGPHAETSALRAAGRSAVGATAYVSLEPCSHTGKTPPCCDALIRARVARVVVAMKDPTPLVAGKGLRRLRSAGISVETGLMREEAGALNAPFVTFHTEHRPYVILKWAQSIDGKIATRRGDSKWITSRHSRVAAHALRARVDAIIIGVNTVIADDPDLTARLARPRRIAARIILDPHLRTPPSARLVRTARRTPTILVTGQSNPARRNAPAAGETQKMRRLKRAGCEVLRLPADRSGIRIPPLLRELHTRGMTNLLVEGGGKVLGAFLDANLADEAQVFVAPIIIGGETAPGPLRCLGPRALPDAPRIIVRDVAPIGPDLCYNVKIG